jgi:hypothetical protein
MYEFVDSDGDMTILDTSPSFTKSDYWMEVFGNPALQQAVTSRFTQAGGVFTEIDLHVYENIPSSGSGMALGRLPIAGGFILYFQFSKFNYYSVNSAYEQMEAVYAQIDAANTTGKSDEELLAGLGTSDAVKREALEVRRMITTTQLFFDGLKAPDLKGVIIDVRANSGGFSSDMSWLWGRMISREHTFAYIRAKLGDNRLDYGPWMPFKIFPAPDGAELHVPIVALVNKLSTSCAEIGAMVTRSLPNGYVVGGTTYGGFGSPVDSRYANGGSFSGPHLESVYTASDQVKYLDGVNYEGRGFPPDIFVPFDYDALQAGTDTRLEAAIQCVLDNQ